jgi:hypothetical protein
MPLSPLFVFCIHHFVFFLRSYMILFIFQPCKIQTRPLVREGALHEEASICQTKEHVKCVHGPQRGARHQDILTDLPTDRPTDSRKVALTPIFQPH